jgi:tetratricopeptide (TPR) repeat protein
LDPALAAKITAAHKAVEASPESAEAWGKLAHALDAAEFRDEARICYQRASELEPGSARWLYLLGLIQMQNDPSAALANLTRAAELAAPTNDAPRLRLAQALIERGRFNEATPHLEELMKRNPSHAAARLEMARVKFASNDLSRAAELLQPCLTNAFTDRPAHLLLSQIKLRTGDAVGAALLARRAGSMPRGSDWPDPYLREVLSLLTDASNLAQRANGLLMQRRFTEAETVLNQLLARTPESAEGLLLLGRLRIQERRCAEAEAILQRHLAVRTNSLQGFVQLGLARYCESRWADAAAAFKTALELKPDFAQAHYNLGLALSRDGNSNAAIDAFRNALRCQPGDPNTHGALAEELLRIGKTFEAGKEAEEALRIDTRQAKALRVREAVKGK